MTILDKAKDIIWGDREKTYGSPARNLQVVADFWENFLHARGHWNSDSHGLTPEDVCLMMGLLKIARLTNSPGHEDSLVDLCGYTALIERVKDADLTQAQGDRPSA